MEKTKLSSKGQVIIPKDIRDALGWEPGDELLVEQETGRVVLSQPKPFRKTTLDEVSGCLKAHYSGPARTVEEMDAAVAEMFRREWTMDGSRPGKRGRKKP